MQGAELPAEAVSGLPGGASDPAGVGKRGAASANHKPGYQLLLWPVSPQTTSWHEIPSPYARTCCDCGGFPIKCAKFVQINDLIASCHTERSNMCK